MCILFIDFKKDYDSFIRSKLWGVFGKNYIPEKKISLVTMCVEEARKEELE